MTKLEQHIRLSRFLHGTVFVKIDESGKREVIPATEVVKQGGGLYWKQGPLKIRFNPKTTVKIRVEADNVT